MTVRTTTACDLRRGDVVPAFDCAVVGRSVTTQRTPTSPRVQVIVFEGGARYECSPFAKFTVVRADGARPTFNLTRSE